MTENVEKASNKEAAQEVIGQLNTLHAAILLAVKLEHDIASLTTANNELSSVSAGAPTLLTHTHVIDAAALKYIVRTGSAKDVSEMIGASLDILMRDAARKLLDVAGKQGGFALFTPPHTQSAHIRYDVGIFSPTTGLMTLDELLKELAKQLNLGKKT
jgi:hypothetical protein